MTTQTLQQTLIKAWHARTSRMAAVSLGLVLLVLGLVIYRGGIVPAGGDRPVNTRPAVAQTIPAPQFSAASPALIGTGSAYDGRTDVVVRPARGNSPIQTAASSAYDGQSYRSAPAAAPFVRDIPASSASTVVRVPYEAGWQLYDNGWAGSPRTTP
jgi:hypothetical protein